MPLNLATLRGARTRSSVSTNATSRTLRRQRGQGLAEFALVAPILLLIFAAAADFGRAFYAYVAIENAAKEGAFFGSRAPVCDDATGGACLDPNNVTWRVRSELKQQGVRNPDGSELTPTIVCKTPLGVPRASVTDCIGGDIYEVGVVYPFKLLTPILGTIIGDLNLQTASRAVVLNVAFDPSPGASINKYVSPTGADNGADIVSKCLEPDDTDAAGFYRSPCRDTSTSDPTDTLTLLFEEGTSISYRIRYGNSGAQPLTGVTVTDSQGSTGCTIPSSMAVGFSQTCDYVRVAPAVTGGGTTMPLDNIATVDSTQTNPATSGVTVIIEQAPPGLVVRKYVSPYFEGNDGDGSPIFGTLDTIAISYTAQVPSPYIWFKVVVTNSGGSPASGMNIVDSAGPLPFGQNNATANCPSAPSSLAAGASWVCRYRVSYSSASAASNANTVTATSPDVVPDSNDSATATVQVAACTGANRTVPNLIGLAKAPAVTAWSNAGFTGSLTTWNGQPNALVVAQGRQAFSCVATASGMTVSRVATP